MTSPCAECVRAQPLLGTLVELGAVGSTTPVVEAAIDRGFVALRAVHARMSFHEAASDLSRIHVEAWRQPVRVHPWTWRVLRVARFLAMATDGAFDPTVGGTLVAAGRLPAPAFVPAPAPEGTWQDVVLLSGSRVWLRRPVLIDLGGIAKGFAVDRAVAAMRLGGVSACRVNAGGDLRVWSPEPQRVSVRHPGRPDWVLPLVDVWNGAVATSAPYRDETGTWSGIVDPAGGPAGGTKRSVTVFASTCLRADALTKVVALAPSACTGLLRQLGAEAVIIETDGSARHLPVDRRGGWRLAPQDSRG